MQQWISPEQLEQLTDTQKRAFMKWGKEHELTGSSISIGHILWFLDEHIMVDTSHRSWGLLHKDDLWGIQAQAGIYQGLPVGGFTEPIDALWAMTKFILGVKEEQGLPSKDEKNDE